MIRAMLRLWAVLGLLLSVLGVSQGGQPNGRVIEDFESGNTTLFSFPGEDLDPNGWSLDSIVTHNGSLRSLKLTGNTWKVRSIQPTSLDSGDVWNVAANVTSLGEAQGFGISDSLHSLFFAFAGSEQLNTDVWATVYQGAFSLSSWHPYSLPVADEWLTRYGYLPLITSIVFVNDRDTDPSAVVYFDDIIDITEDLPLPPTVTITHVPGSVYLNPLGQRSITVQFFSHVTDPDSGVHTYFWQFGDNSSSALASPTHTFVVEDDHEYTVLLEVRDETGLWGRASVRISIDQGPTSFPIRMNFVGDIMMARGYEAPGGIIPTQGVQAIFAPTVSSLGANADITVANLECSLTQSTTAHPTKPIVFKSSPQNVAGLVYAGIDVVTIANNHIIDYGLAGLQETQSVLRQNGIRYSGAGANSYEACLPLLYSRSGVCFAFVAMSDRTGQYNNYQPYLNAGEDKPGFAMLTPFELQRQISRARAVADRVVVELHSGIEYSTAPSLHLNEGDEGFSPDLRRPTETDRSLRRLAIDLGADAVVNHHSHIIQGFEVHNQKLIAHSMGNFAFDLGYPETFPSMILDANVDSRRFYEYTVTPVYIDHYIPRRATGQLGTYILDYLAMRSKELGTYLIVNRDSVRASIVLDTLTLWPRSTTTARTLPLAQSNSWYVSKPERLTRNGSIASIPSITPQGNWQYRLGREVVWFGNCENEGCLLWLVDASDESYDSTVAHDGRRSIQHRRTSGAATLQTNCEKRLMPSTVAPGFSLCGWIRTNNARDATIRAKLYGTRTGSEIGSGDIGTLVNGSLDWTFYANDIVTPSDVHYVDVILESKAPTSGTGYAWFDDVGLIEWTDWMTYDGTGQCVYPNDFYWVQVRSSTSYPSATIAYREVRFDNASQPLTLSVSVESGWNLISNPITNPQGQDSVRSLFPSSLLDHAFMFSPTAGYVPSVRLHNGIGYWGKFPQDESFILEGVPIRRDTIPVFRGWNLIGSISVPVDTSMVCSIPSGLRSSHFYSYSHGYFPSAELLPGKGYWVNSDDSGLFVLVGGMSKLARNTHSVGDMMPLTFTSADGEVRVLYFSNERPAVQGMLDLPPAPPTGVMDVRYEANCLYAFPDTTGPRDWPIVITSAAFPVTISWSNLDLVGKCMLKVNGREYSLEKSGSVLVSNTAARVSLVFSAFGKLPREFALAQNYPNPFNMTTRITYALPAFSGVSLEVYNITGQLVRTLVKGDQETGWYAVEWDGMNEGGVSVGSGVYFYRLSANGLARRLGSFTATKKVLLLK